MLMDDVTCNCIYIQQTVQICGEFVSGLSSASQDPTVHIYPTAFLAILHLYIFINGHLIIIQLTLHDE